MHSYNELEDFIARKREVSSFHNTKMNISDLKDWNLTTKGALAHESGRFFSINSVTPIQAQKSILNQRDIGLCLFKTVVKCRILSFAMQGWQEMKINFNGLRLFKQQRVIFKSS